MSTNKLTQQFNGHPIVSISNGQIIAKVEDILIDPDALQVAALVTTKRGGGLFQRKQEVAFILGDKVQVWGQDIVLVSAPDVIIAENEAPGSEKWLSVSEQIKGRDVISIDGRRIGQLDDAVLDTEGKVVEYDLGQVFIKGPIAQSSRIAVETTHALGQDVLLVQVVETVEPALPAELPESDIVLEDTSLEDIALEDAALEDIALEDIALEDTSLEDIALEDIALEDAALEDTSLEDTALEEDFIFEE